MALKTKLFLAFILMIMLSAGTAVISISAFRKANASIDEARGMLGYVTGNLIPANDRWMNISSHIISGSLNYYAYAYNFEAGDFQYAVDEMTAADRELAELSRILSLPGSGGLVKSRAAYDECVRRAKEMTDIGRQLNQADLRLKELSSQFVSLQEQLSAIADEQYNSSYAALKELLGKADVDPGESAKRSGKIEFVSGLFDAVAWGNTAFWHAHSLRGETANGLYGETIGHMDTLIKDIDEYNVPETVPDAAERRHYDDIKAFGQRMRATVAEIKEVYSGVGTLTERIGTLSESTAVIVREASRATAAQVVDNTQAVSLRTDGIGTMVDSAETMQFAFLGITVVAGLGLAFGITRSIVNPIDQVISQLNHGEGVISNAADNIAGASRNLAEGANEQAAALEQTSSALEQIASMSKLSAENAHRTNEQTRDTVKLIQAGAASMREMSGAMAEINDKSEKVSHIIKTIEDIAFQTNLLALNAAVEAARAGEAGKGFAVVADEVRNLSQRSAAAARDTTALIQGTVESVRSGAHITGQLTESYHGIEKGAGAIGELIDQIARASTEQAEGVEQVNNAVTQMDKVTQQNAASSEETASASTGLTDQLDSLRGTIAHLSGLVYGRKKQPARLADAAPPPSRPRSAPSSPARKGPARPAPRLSGPKPARSGPPQQTVMRPDQVIPLEGDGSEFEEF